MVMKTPVSMHTAVIVEHEPCAQGLWRMFLKAPRLAECIKPGQFFNLKVPGVDQDLLRVPLSFSRTYPETGLIELVYATVGSATRRLSELPAETLLSLLGPSGQPWPRPKREGRALLVSGGVGITPIIAVASMLAELGVAFDVVVGAQTKARLWGLEALSDLGAERVVVTTDDGTQGLKGFTTLGMQELLDERNDYTQVYTCGPSLMMAAIARLAAEHKLDCYASLERLMACSFGACGTCVVALKKGGYASCCMNGPVFDAEEVLW